MRNKKGQMFALYMVFITIAMIIVVLGMYYTQQKNIQSKIISPMNILYEKDRLEIFEARELELVKGSLEEASGSFGTNDFLNSFRVKFFDGMNSEMKEFLLDNLYKGEIQIDVYRRDVVENAIYPGAMTYYNTDKSMIFIRDSLTRKYEIISEEDKILFPVDFSFGFGKQYIIRNVDGEFVVEALG